MPFFRLLICLLGSLFLLAAEERFMLINSKTNEIIFQLGAFPMSNLAPVRHLRFRLA